MLDPLVLLDRLLPAAVTDCRDDSRLAELDPKSTFLVPLPAVTVAEAPAVLLAYLLSTAGTEVVAAMAGRGRVSGGAAAFCGGMTDAPDRPVPVLMVT
jgi:hypothetical protein